MISTRESAESSVDPTKSTTSTQANVIVPSDSTLFKEYAPSVREKRPTTSILKPATVLLAKTPMSSTPRPPTPASASLNTSGSEEFAPTATPVNTMTHTLTDACANLDTSSSTDTASLFAPLVPLTSMENACAPAACPSTMANARAPRDVLFTLTGTRELSAVSVMLDTES